MPACPSEFSKPAIVSPPALAGGARPRVVVSCEGLPTWATNVPAMYAEHSARFLSTWPHGAVTFISHTSGLVAETFLTREHFVVRSGSEKQIGKVRER